MCCGAGGGCFWKEAREGSRINRMRFDELNEAKPDTLAVGCPFCMTQMEDAMKARSTEEKMRVRDISELIADLTGGQEFPTAVWRGRRLEALERG
ncbi:MAG TPA: (Fe-S)-binding protein [Candidatus Binataceae bacterium]|nr:(Fe-S)-binding protein [Candidatus Binataceae bacterium]